MIGMIHFFLARTRTTLLLLLFLVISGTSAYWHIPKEANPDVTIPMIYVSVALEGISPEDAERLLIRPLEIELSNLKGLKEMNAIASEGHGSIILKFNAGFDSEKAYRDVQDKINQAVGKLPQSVDKPLVREINIALFPVISVLISGQLTDQAMLMIARDLQDRLEASDGVLEVNIRGDLEDILEVTIEPAVLETYGLTLESVMQLVQRNNQLIAAGSMEHQQGRLSLKIPGTLDTLDDFLNLPVKVENAQIVSLGDIASLRRSYKTPSSVARLNGEPTLALEVSKRIGSNIINTIEKVKAVTFEAQQNWPKGVTVDFQQDGSVTVKTMLSELENSVIAAVLIVMIIMMSTLGIRSALLVSTAIPGSFLIGILVLSWMGYSLNMITLFSLILVVGMLVDDAIVVAELADRKMIEGMSPKVAYRYATIRMLWPITAATLTKIVVFLPLIFWPGVAGDFMKYLPITVIITLIASWFMAIIFLPVLGSIFGKAGQQEAALVAAMKVAESGDLHQIKGGMGYYLRFLRALLAFPWLVLSATITLVVAIYMIYGTFGRGVEFFPAVEPDFAQIQIRARGDLSIYEKDSIVQEVEKIILGTRGVRSVYASVLATARNDGSSAPDLIGLIQLEFTDWMLRPPASQILASLRDQTSHLPGIILNFKEADQGPSSGAPIQLEIAGNDPVQSKAAVLHLRSIMENLGTLQDITDNLPIPSIEWKLIVDRQEAARLGVDLSVLGSTVQLLTQGLNLAKYRPIDVKDEVDVRVRLPAEYQHLGLLETLSIATMQGQVPLDNFVKLVPQPAVNLINRTNSVRVFTIEAYPRPDQIVAIELNKIMTALKDNPLPEGTRLIVKGDDEDQRESGNFLVKAFMIGIFLMIVVLVTEFNSLYQTMLVMSAIVISTAGVLLGMLITNQPFSIVMGGIGVIALAGIVVNNNIVLIDAYNQIRQQGQAPVEAVLRASAQRLRPVLLTSLTTVLGLLPMVLQMTIDLFNRELTFGAPSTQWWTQLASSIAGGMTFATLLTLVVTPCMLVVGERLFKRKNHLNDDSLNIS